LNVLDGKAGENRQFGDFQANQVKNRADDQAMAFTVRRNAARRLSRLTCRMQNKGA